MQRTGPVEPSNPSLKTYESSIMNYVFKHDVPAPNVLMGAPGPKISTKRHKRPLGFVPMGADPIPPHMERLEYAKRLKMLSLNPCIYGNIYGVLGSS